MCYGFTWYRFSNRYLEKNLAIMKEILKKIVNFLKQSDKLKHCLVNLLVMLIAGSINIWLGIGLAAGKEYSKTLSIIKNSI